MYRTGFNSHGESVVVSYVLVIGLFTILSALLISSAGGYLQTKQDSVTEVQAEITVEAIAAEIQEVDKHARKMDGTYSSAGYITYNSQTDKLIGQYPYKVRLRPTGEPDKYTIELSVQTAKIDVVEQTNVTLTTIDSVNTSNVVSGSTLAIEYTRNGELRLVRDRQQFAVDQTSNYDIPDDTILDGAVRTDGDLTGGENSYVYGPVYAGGFIDFDDATTVAGDVTADLAIQIDDNSMVTGDVVSQTGPINLRSGASVGQNVQTPSDVTTEQGVLVGETIASGGTVTLGDNTKIRGDVDVDSEFDLICGSNVMINNQTCATYKSNNY